MTPKLILEVDRLGREVADRRAEIQKLEETLAPIEQKLIGLVEREGIVPPKAEKTRRLEGAAFIADVSVAQTVSVDQAATAELERFCRENQPRGVFKKLFSTETRYLLERGAEEAMVGAHKKLQALFQATHKVKSGKPKLTVREKNESASK